jgi:hypothetical protein
VVKTLNEHTYAFRVTTVLEKWIYTLYTRKKAANVPAENFKSDIMLKVHSRRRREVKTQLHKKLRDHADPTLVMTANLTMAELKGAIQKQKHKQAPGKGGACNEMIKHLGPLAREKLLNCLINHGTITTFRQLGKKPHFIVILRRNKDPKQADSYRPISLLRCTGKTLERIVNTRLLKSHDFPFQIPKKHSN